jgi:hypothetical protein
MIFIAMGLLIPMLKLLYIYTGTILLQNKIEESSLLILKVLTRSISLYLYKSKAIFLQYTLCIYAKLFQQPKAPMFRYSYKTKNLSWSMIET